MPIYDYLCKSCEARFEGMATIADRDSHVPECPECGGESTQRVPSRVSTTYDIKGALTRAGDGFKEVQQKIIERGVGSGHTIRTK